MKYPAKYLPVALETKNGEGAFFNNNNLAFEVNNEKFEIDFKSLPLKGTHNAINIMCAVLALKNVGLSYEQILTGLKSFHNAPHRLELVATIDGVEYVNDSKATNVDSVFYALGSFEKPIVLIMGGVDKGNDYSQIDELVRQKAKALICLGKDNSKLKDYFNDKIDLILETQDIKEALLLGKGIASNGDVVLLSPACASFDLFKNYEDRGTQFREAVNQLL
jgi:UDP-N-acetylmuramoylalanine--D-glutamate ligase